MNCPCGTNTGFEICCEPLLLKNKIAESPEQLMRSRYSAYYMMNSTYIYDTYSSSSRINNTLDDIDAWIKETQWLNLHVIKSTEFKKNKNPTVQFEAIYKNKNNNKLYKMSETSIFTKENNLWRYVNGIKLNFDEIDNPKRNDKCICCSGIKYKKCCGTN